MASKDGMLPNKYSFWIECASALEEEYSEKCSNIVLTLEVGTVRSTLPFQPCEDVLKDKNEF